MMSRIVVLLSLLLLLIACERTELPFSEQTKIISSQFEQPIESNMEQETKEEATHPIEEKYIGTFSVEVETEATTTGMASIEYTFTITSEFILLETNTYHEPIRCNGKYTAVEKENVLELYYTGNEEFCDTESPMFFLKEKRGKLYAQGLGGEGTYHDWIKLKRK